MIKIDTDKCIGCGRCVQDCFPREIKLAGGKAVPEGRRCIECGHCIAVCPVNAVSLSGYDMQEAIDLNGLDFKISPELFLNHLKTRRSIRRFTDAQVSEDDIRKIIEAGRFAPTGGNLQDVSYYVSRNNISELKDMLFEELKAMGESSSALGGKAAFYGRLWLDMYDEYKNRGTDRLFFNAGTVIAVSSVYPQSACFAAAHMETMVFSLGLGMLYSGFSVMALSHSPVFRKHLKLKTGQNVHAVLVIGHPDVKYLRTAPRKPADIIWS